MSRGRVLSKVGGLTQTIAGISTFVGISTFASDVRIHGKLDVDGDISYDEMTSVNSKVTGVSTVTDIRVDRNLKVAGITTVTGALVVDSGTTITNIQIGVTGNNEIDTESGNLTIDSAGGTTTIDDAAAITGNLTVTGNTVLNGTIDLGDATSDTITPTARFDAALVPATDNAIDLGTSSLEYKDLYIDGTANIDSLVADTADINGGTADNVVIGGSTAAAGSFTTVAASSNLTVSGNGSVTGTFDVDGATTLDGLTVAEGASFSSTLDVDGATTLDGLTVAEGATFSSTLGVTGTTTLSGQLDANGDVNLGNATTDSVTVTGRFDSDLLPIADGTSNLGSSTLEWQDLYIDGTANIDALVADTAIISDLTLGRVVLVGASGELTDNASLTFTSSTLSTHHLSAIGNVDLGNGTEDTITATGRFDSDLVPSTDGARDLGTSTLEWQDLYIDGTANIDSLVADTADINGGTIDGVTIGGASAGAGSFTTVAASSNATITGNLDVDGDTTLDTTDVAGTLTVVGDAVVDNVTVNGNTVSTSSGNLTLDSAGGTVSVADNLTVSGNFTVNGTTNTVNSTTVTIADKNFQVATGSADDSVADGGGLTVDSGDGDKTWNFEATGDNWGSNQNINAASGKVYKINNTSVLSATTLGSGVVNSSLTTLGTIATGVWQGTAIANGYLANSTVSYGGVSLALGASDATPAFDLQDATGYPTSSLTGTITNAQLAGSIANAKLSNSTVSYGGVSLALGASDATPAFNLTDATNYPTSSLSGTITNAQLAGSIADSKLNTISTAGKVDLASLEIDGGTDIGADLVDADLFIVDDGAGGTNRKTTGTRIKKYIWSSASGDATASDSGAITLANSGVSAATIGSGSAIPILTIDAKGRITNTSTAAIDSTAISQGNTNVTVTDSGTGSIVASVDGTTTATIAAAGITLGQGAFVGAVTGSTISASGNVDFNGNLDVDGTTYLDNTDIVGTLNITGFTNIDNVTVNAGTVSTSSGDLILNSTGGTVYVYDHFDVEGNSTFQGNTTHQGNIIGDNNTNISNIDEVAAVSLDISGNADIDGTLEADAITVDGTALNEYIADTIGAMVSSNTESGITVAYQDADNTLDFTVGTLNQDTTGNAATATALATGRTIGMTGDVTWTSASFDGTGNVTGSATLAASGVSAGTVGSSSAIPIITVDAKGRITNTSTTAIDSTTISNGGGSVAVGSGGAITVTGNTTFANNINLGDDDTITFGAGSDGTIHSDGSNFLIQGSANGQTYLRGSTLNLSANGGSGGYNSAVVIDVSGDERVQLKYGSTTRLTTTSSGLTLTGTTTGTFSGNLTGNASGSSGSCTGNSATATLATNSTITANNSTDETVYPVFVDGATGTQGLESATGFSFNPSSNIITAGGISVASIQASGNTDLNGNLDVDGTCEADAYTVNGTALNTYIASITVTNASTAANAQLLDSLDSTQFLRSDASDTFTGTLTVSGDAAIDNVTINGNTVSTGSGNLTLDSSGGTVSVADNLTISGNLTVNGTTTTVDTTNTNVSDNLIELNSGAGSNSNDSGIIIERGSTGDNAIIAWDESADKFTVGTTTATNDATGNISITTGTLVANIEGNVTGNVTGNTSGSSGSCTGNAATATALANARTIAGVSFDGTGNISLNNNAITNGAAYITSSGTSAACSGNSATATLATNVTVTANNGNNENVYLAFVDSSSGGTQGIETDAALSYNPSTNALTTTEFIGGLTGNVTGNTSGSSGSCTGNAATATILANARTIAGVSFNGSANISLNNNAITNGAGYITATLTNEQVQDIVGGMVSGNTESGITVTYQDGDGTIDFSVASQTDNNFTNTLKSKLDGIASGATAVTNNNQLTNGAGYVTSSGLPTTGGTLTGTLNARAITPTADSTYNLGTNSVRWANVYADDVRTGDLHLSNEHLDGGNTIDGSWGSYQIEEGEDNLFITNKRSGKKFRFVLEQV